MAIAPDKRFSTRITSKRSRRRILIFSLHLALSSPVLEDRWTGHEGFIHEVLLEKDLRERSNAKAAEYYLCGPPMMIKACNKMLYDLVVPANHITYDEF